MRGRPRVSIGLPVWNGERHLDAAISSLLAQTFEDLELIIVDNASVDGTETIARDHAARDPRVRYHRQSENVGAAANFNCAFELAGAEYFKWAAHDDMCEPTYLARCVEQLDERRDVAWCHSRMRSLGPDDEPLDDTTHSPDATMGYLPSTRGDPCRDRMSRGADHAHERLRAVLLELEGDGNWDVFGLARSHLMRHTRLQRPYYGADKVYVAELSLYGRYAEVADVLFVGRVHGGASSALRTSKEQRAWIAPDRSGHSVFTRPRLLAAYVSAVGRSDLDATEKVAVSGSSLNT